MFRPIYRLRILLVIWIVAFFSLYVSVQRREHWYTPLESNFLLASKWNFSYPH